jgi:integrase
VQGSIKKRIGKTSVAWYAMVDLPRDPVTGRRRQKRVSAPTRRECEERIRELVRETQDPNYREPDKSTVAEYIAAWLESVEPGLRASTFRRYRDMMVNHVQPKLGHIKLAKLSPLDVQRFYADRHKSGLSSTTVHHIHVVLHRALRQAVRWGMIPTNATEMVDAPKRTLPEVEVWDAAQVTRFFLKSDPHYLSALWRLALLTGMRRGELLGLRWEDISLDDGRLSVRRTLSRAGGGVWELGPPKTKAGRRSIALPESCVTALRKHRAMQNAERLRLGALWEDNNFVFTNRTGGPLHPNSLALQFKQLTKLANLPTIRFHDLRHTSATLLLAQGVHAKIVQERLGHSDISMTLNRYSHVTPDMQRTAADKLDVAFG